MSTSKIWSVYLLICNNRTYVGCTTDVKRRLRQHNGEIRGGARATRKSGPNWQMVMYVSGFRNRSEACRWEALVKKRARGVGPRKAALWGLTAGVCPTGRTVFVVPRNLEGVCLITDEYDLKEAQ